MTETSPPPDWILRPALLSDAPAVLEAFLADPEMARQGDVTDLEDARTYLRRLTDAPTGHRAWVAVDDAGPARALVGLAIDSENLTGWFFYWAYPAVRGTGVMSAAAAAVADHALDPDGLGLERLELGHRANNPASGGVARAAGFVQEGVERAKFLVDGERIDVLTYGRLRSDPAPVGPRLPLGTDHVDGRPGRLAP